MPRRYSRHRRPSDTDAMYIALLLLACVLWVHRSWLVYGLYGLALLLGLGMVIVIHRIYIAPKRRIMLTTLAEIDMMDGLEFERYVADLLRHHGYTKVRLTERYDLGIDIVAEKDNELWGIQVKRHKSLVGADAVRAAVTALKAYHCDKAMVITNSRYSSYTKRLARLSDCVLIDKTGLMKLIRTSSAVITNG
jgi:HJR/Mrr/RecB family endonuclease